MMTSRSSRSNARTGGSRRYDAAALLSAALIAATTSGLLPRAAFAAAGAGFQTTANPGGGEIVTGTLSGSTLPALVAALLREVHVELGARPTVVSVAQNPSANSVTLLFTATRGSTPYTGVAIVTAPAGAQPGGAALYDTSARFPKTVTSMMSRLQSMTDPSSAAAAKVTLAPAEPLETRSFPDGTGTIGLPADWKLAVAGGGSANASGPGASAQVSYNIHFNAYDPSNPRSQMVMHTGAARFLHAVPLTFTSDPARAWQEMFMAQGKALGFTPDIHVTSTTANGPISTVTGTLGTGPKAITFIETAFVLPPDPNGMWSVSDSHVWVQRSKLASEGATAMAVLSSIRINFGAVASQNQAIRTMFQQKFEAEIANDQAQDAARQRGTDMALARDRAAQEGMHKSAVAMENYSLDRAVVVNRSTGVHSTIDSDFADDLVRSNPNYQKVPAQNLLRGVDY
jgi:hypothetical protein